MAKVKPLVLRFDNASDLEKAKANYDYIGQETDINWEKLELTVRTLPRKYKRKTEKEAQIKARKEQNSTGDYSY